MAAKKFKTSGVKVDTGVLKSFTKAHDKEVNRVRRIVKRLSEKGYDINKAKLGQLYVSHTNKLKNVTRKSLIQQGYVTVQDYYVSKGVRKTPENIQKILQKKFSPTGKHIPRENVYQGSDASVKMDVLEKVAKYGTDYSGDYTKKASGKSAAISVNKSGGRILTIIRAARAEHGDEECVRKLEAEYGSINALAEIVERMVLAIYDKVYAEWGNGVGAYQSDINDLVNALDVTDPGF